MDALTHAIEAYVALGSQPFASALALHAIGLVAGNLRQAVANDQNLAATQNMVIASALAGMAFSNARLGTVHAMAHPLSAHCGIHHGTACAILLPHVMEFNLGACPEKYAEIARAMGGTTAGLAVMDAARLAVEAVRALASDVDIPANLRAAGATPDRLQELIGDSMLSGAIRNNPRTTGKEDVEHLFSKAFA
jgi:alcohol dehydrogenase class IV